MDRLRSVQQGFGLTFSLHLCEYSGIMLDSLNEDVRRASMASSLKAIRAGQALDVQQVVAHVAGTWPRISLIAGEAPAFPEVARAELMERVVQQAGQGLRALTQEVPARALCLEHLLVDFCWTARLVEEFDTSVCFDGGHWARVGNRLTAFVEKYGERIALIHCHDVQDGVDHRPLCTGPDEAPVLDWEGALAALRERGFDGPVVLEFYGLEGKAWSLRYLQRLRGEG
jgi:sugar phosphate isomerase/epimerase